MLWLLWGWLVILWFWGEEFFDHCRIFRWARFSTFPFSYFLHLFPSRAGVFHHAAPSSQGNQKSDELETGAYWDRPSGADRRAGRG